MRSRLLYADRQVQYTSRLHAVWRYILVFQRNILMPYDMNTKANAQMQQLGPCSMPKSTAADHDMLRDIRR